MRLPSQQRTRRPAYVQLNLNIDDFCLQSLDATEIADFYEICVDATMEGRRQRGGSSPTSPSTDSRMRSAWPTCRAYSSIRSIRRRRRLGARPSGQVRWGCWSRPPSASTSVATELEPALV